MKARLLFIVFLVVVVASLALVASWFWAPQASSGTTVRGSGLATSSAPPERTRPQTEAPSKPNDGHSEVITCEQKPVSSTGEILRSQFGARAFVDVRASLTKTGEETATCEATWTLHVAAPGSDQFSAIEIHRRKEEVNPSALGGDSSMYYSANIIGWSHDGNTVLANAVVAAYEDWYKVIAATYNTREKKLLTADLESLFAQHSKQNCPLSFKMTGFVSSTEVLADVRPFEWVDDPNCFTPGLWVVDLKNGKVRQAPPGSEPKNISAN